MIERHEGLFRGEPRRCGGPQPAALRRPNPRSEFVIFLDNDDVWLPEECSAPSCAVLDAHPVYAGARRVGAVHRRVAGTWCQTDDLEQRLRDRKGFHDGRSKPVEPSAPTTFRISCTTTGW